jgi:sulfonate transport system substrate-binding protein
MNSVPRRVALASAAALLAAPARADAALHVSYVLRPFNVPQAVMRQRGLLEQRLKPIGMDVVWHDITSGVLQAQALAAGSLDIGTVMNPISVILALANGNPLRIVAGFARVARLAAIMAVDPAIRSIPDLRGCTVAGLKGAVPHQLLIKALQSSGMNIRDVTFLDMDLPTSYAALLAGHVQVAVLAADLILKAQRAGAHEVLTPPKLIQPVNVVCARNSLIEQRPDAVRLYKDAQREAIAFVQADPEAAIRIGCEVNGLDVADGRALFTWQTFETTLSEADLASLEQDMTFLIENHLCPRSVDLRAALFEAMQS